MNMIILTLLAQNVTSTLYTTQKTNILASYCNCFQTLFIIVQLCKDWVLGIKVPNQENVF